MKTLLLLLMLCLNAGLTQAQKRLTNREIYNFSVGDVIHIYDSYKNRIECTKREFVEDLSTGNDAFIFLVRDSIYELKYMYWALTIKTRHLVYSNLDAFPSPRLDTSHYDSCGVLLNKAKFTIPDTIIFEGQHFDEIYYKGLGRYYLHIEDADNGARSYHNLLYYQKAGSSCGERIQLADLNSLFMQKLTFYPNPVAHTLRIEGFSNGNYEIYNLEGQVIGSGGFEGEIPVGSISPGVYYLKMQYADRYYAGKFIKE